jgi:hypothetical protein
MPILKPPAKPPKNETLQIRIEEGVRSKLQRYAEFIDSSESYVVSEALNLLFRKDEEFKTWLHERPHSGNQPPKGADPSVEAGKRPPNRAVSELSQPVVFRSSE